MTNNIIEVKNISKKYNITRYKGGYIALRDVLTNVAKRPFSFLKHKAKEVVGRVGKEEFWALKDVNFTVERGEAVGIIGHNGAGKSTLLKILSQITPPTTGEIRLKGRVSSLLEVGTGFHPELTGRENIFLNGAILGMTKKEINDKFDSIVEFAGIEKFIDTPVKRYSSGMYVRLAFSVAAHMDPDILLVDEVLAVGDVEFQKKCLGKMDEVIKESGRTILFVSHNMGAIQNLCKKCILLKNGRVEMIGKTEEVIKRYLNNVKNDAKIPIKKRVDRRGSGDVIITDIKILDEKTLSRLETITSGQNIYIEISYTSKSNIVINDLNMGLALFNSRGQFVTVLNSQMANKKFVDMPSDGKIYCFIPKTPFMSGKYYLKSTLHINGILSDQIENALTFEIKVGDYYKTGIPNDYGNQGVYIQQYWVQTIKHNK